MNPVQTGKRVTMHDIGRKLNLSQPTISRALRNDPQVSKKVIARVKKAAEAMGYRPDPVLSALISYRLQQVKKPISAELAWLNCWPIPQHLRGTKEYDLYWQGAYAEAERAGYRLEEFNYNAQTPVARLLSVLNARNITGLIIPPHIMPVDWTGFDWQPFSIVRCGWGEELPRAHRVACDQLQIGMTLFDVAASKGYRRIGYITFRCSGPAPGSLSRRFIAGYLYAQSRMPANQHLPPLYLAWGQETLSRKQIKEWMAANKPDAILTDQPAVRPLLEELGVAIPDDVAFATATLLENNATTGIDQNTVQIGRAAVQMLISLIHHQETGLPTVQRELLIEGTWVDGPDMPVCTRQNQVIDALRPRSANRGRY